MVFPPDFKYQVFVFSGNRCIIQRSVFWICQYQFSINREILANICSHTFPVYGKGTHTFACDFVNWATRRF